MRRFFAALVTMVMAASLGASALATPLRPTLPMAMHANTGLLNVHGYHCDYAYGLHRHSHRGRSHRHPHWHRHPGSCYHGKRFTVPGTRDSMPMFYYPPDHPRWRWRDGRPRRR